MELLEVACFNPESALIAAEAGADRIELCDAQDLGGTTPPHTWLATLKSRIDVRVFVMIRPRGGDFNYSEAEYQEMKDQIDEFKADADGFVFGILKKDRTIDASRTSELVVMAHPLPCTFHRAFDEVPDPLQEFESVIATGCQTLLSSGGASSAIGGMDVLCRLVEKAQGRITVMPGGGVRSRDLQLLRQTGACAFHSSALSKGSMLPDASEIRQMKTILSSNL